MAKRSFLKPLSAVIAALASATPWTASEAAVDSTSAPLAPDATHRAADGASAPVAVGEMRDVLMRENGDVFKFVLKRAEDGRFLAYHSSHSSHDSHSSHSSHRSHYSSR